MAAQNEDLVSYGTGTCEKYTSPSGAYSLVYSVPVATLQRKVVVSSVSTPNWRKVQKTRNKPMNNYGKTVFVRWDALSGFSYYEVNDKLKPDHPWYAWENRVYQLTNTSYFGVDLLKPTVRPDDPTGRAINDLLQKLSEGKTNTLVTAAEINKTVDMVAKTATKLYKAISALRKGRLGDFTDALGITTSRRFRYRYESRVADVRSRYFSSREYESRMRDVAAKTMLEVSYGWKPLLKDIHDHAKALAELSVERQNVLRHAKGRGETSRKEKIETSPKAPYKHTIFHDMERKCEIGVWYTIQNGQLNPFTQLGIDNPMLVAWEVIPFSFIADWFVPVGNYIQSLTATNGLVFHSGYVSRRDITKGIWTSIASAPDEHSFGHTYYSGGGVSTVNDIKISRNYLSSFPSPSPPRFKDPRDTVDGGITRALNAISLLQTLFLSKR